MDHSRADTVAAVVNWYGPFEGTDTKSVLTNARRAALKFKGTWNGLYMAIGSGEAARRGPRQMLYVGVGNPLESRLSSSHHKLGLLKLGAIWLGEVAVHGIADAHDKKIDIHLDMAEWVSAFFLELPYNNRKRQHPPEWSCVVTNRWWASDFSTRQDRPNQRWPDIIDYDRWRRTAYLIRYGYRPEIVEKRQDKVVRPGPAMPSVFEP